MPHLWALYLCTTLTCGEPALFTGERFADFERCREQAIGTALYTSLRAYCYSELTGQAWLVGHGWWSAPVRMAD